MSHPNAPLRSLLGCLSAAALVTAHGHVASAAPAMTRAEYEACQAREEGNFRAAIETLTRNGLEAGLANLDYRAAIGDEWRRGNVDEVIDRQVDQAIGEIREQSSWLDLWSSLASRERAEALAVAAAERVYRSDAIKAVIAELATRVGKEIGARIELATLDTAGAASACIETFLGSRYGDTIARIVATSASKDYAIEASKTGAQISAGQVLAESGEGVAGTVVLIVRRQLSRMGTRIGQRIVGAILSRVVSVVAGGIGVVLIAKDIWDFRHGVLPIIAEEMKTHESKAKVREELAKAIGEQIGDSLKEIAANTAERVVAIWREFRRAHAKVVELSGRRADFRGFLETVRVEDLARLDEVVALVLAAEGEDGVGRRLKDGTLDRAVSALPAAALEIARATRSLETALQWDALAGDSLSQVVALEVYRRAKPEAFARASLHRLLGLGDSVAVTRLSNLSPSARTALFELDDGALKRLARALDEQELDSLSRYATGLDTGPAHRLLRAVIDAPARMAELSPASVREAVLSSRDQAAAVGVMLQATALPNARVLIADTRLVLDGRISPRLLWIKHAGAMATAAILLLLGLLLAKRLLFPTRTRIVVAQDRSGGTPHPRRD